MDLLTKIRGEIEARMRELRPALEEYEGLLSAAGGLKPEDGEVGAAPSRRRRAGMAAGSRNGAGPADRAPRGAGQQAIVAALEHGSHTVGELTVVTALSGPSIRQGLRRLVVAGKVARGKREGKTVYTLSAPRR
jgi:hypothetical protein